MTKEVKIVLSNKVFYTLILIGILIVLAWVVVAYGGGYGDASIMGHTANEIDGLSASGSGWVDVTSDTNSFDTNCEYKIVPTSGTYSGDAFYLTSVQDNVIVTAWHENEKVLVNSGDKSSMSGTVPSASIQTFERCDGTGGSGSGGGSDADCTLCETCGGTWPNEQGMFHPSITNSREYRGASCSGDLIDRGYNNIHLCCDSGGGSGGSNPDYDSGWVASPGLNTNQIFTHNFGQRAKDVRIWIAENNDGSGWSSLSTGLTYAEFGLYTVVGVGVSQNNINDINIRIAEQLGWTHNGTAHGWRSSGYIRVLAWR